MGKPNAVGFSVHLTEHHICWLGSTRMLIDWAKRRWRMSGQRTPRVIAEHVTDQHDQQIIRSFRDKGLLNEIDWLKRGTLKEACRKLSLEHALVDIDAASIKNRLLRHGPFLLLGENHVLVISGIYIDDITKEATIFYHDPSSWKHRIEKKELYQLLQDERGAHKVDLYKPQGIRTIRDLGKRKHDWHYQWDIIFLPRNLVPPKVKQSRNPPSKAALNPVYSRHVEQMQQLGWDLAYLVQFFGVDLYGMARRGPKMQVENMFRDWGVLNNYNELWHDAPLKSSIPFLKTQSSHTPKPIKIDLNDDGRPDAILRPGPGGQITGISVDVDGDGIMDHTIKPQSVVMMDIDKDGIMDAMAFDINNDGKFDFVVGDRNGDGVLDWWVNDRNGDGEPDWVAMDLDHDGKIDWLDTDGDGVPDFLGAQYAKGTAMVPGDIDGDGIPDWLGRQFESGFGVFDNTSTFRSAGGDANGNGIPDWMEKGGHAQFGSNANKSYVPGDINGNGIPDWQERGGFQQFNFGFNNPNNPFNPNNPNNPRNPFNPHNPFNPNNPLNPLARGPFHK